MGTKRRRKKSRKTREYDIHGRPTRKKWKVVHPALEPEARLTAAQNPFAKKLIFESEESRQAQKRRLEQRLKEGGFTEYHFSDKVRKHLHKAAQEARKWDRLTPEQKYERWKREVCRKRKQRRASLFASKKSGKGVKGPMTKNIGYASKVKC